MNILLSTLNAKFYHTNLAIRSLAVFCPQFSEHMSIKEYTINNIEDTVLFDICKRNPDVVCFSCYIWNISQTLKICQTLKLMLPNVKIILGGPEVSFNAQELVFGGFADIIVCGEGEIAFASIMEYLILQVGNLESIPNIVYNSEQGVVATKITANVAELDQLPFVYANGFSEFADKMIYYETSRGCPFSCAYCLSGEDSNVRFLSIERCLSDLLYFLSNKVRQVKFIDRTFNCNKKHAMSIWQFLIANDNGVTNFHFELAADLLDADMLNLLKTARLGLFQFEIGVQSTNLNTLEQIKRKTNLEKVFANVEFVRNLGTIDLHLDLIAGLPHENYDSFRQSFNDVFALRPDQFQLGFLKLLRGSNLREKADELRIIYKPYAPYDVLFTKDLSVQEIILLKNVEEIVNLYYNSKKAINALNFAFKFATAPFDVFEQMAVYWDANAFNDVAHNKAKLYDIMHSFLTELLPNNVHEVSNLLMFDMFLNDRVVNLPTWFEAPLTSDEKLRQNAYIKAFQGNEQGKLNRKLHLQKFAIDVLNFAQDIGQDVVCEKCFVLFDYSKGAGAGQVSAAKINI